MTRLLFWGNGRLMGAVRPMGKGYALLQLSATENPEHDPLKDMYVMVYSSREMLTLAFELIRTVLFRRRGA